MTLVEARALARHVAADLRDGRAVDLASSGWVLWEYVTLTGEELMKPPYSGFGWWQYKTKVALRADGELVAFEENEGRVSPNYGNARGIHVATDSELLYADALRWDEHRSVEEADARTIIDVYRSPAEFSEPAGKAITLALKELHDAKPRPQPLPGNDLKAAVPQRRRGPNPSTYFGPAAYFSFWGGALGIVVGLFAGVLHSQGARNHGNFIPIFTSCIAVGVGVPLVVALALYSLARARQP